METAEDLLLKGEQLGAEGKWEEALSVYEKVVELDPQNWKAHHLLGDACLNLEQYEKAIESYQNCLELNPDFTWAYHNLGITFAKLESWDEVCQCYDKVAQIDAQFWKLNQSMLPLEMGKSFLKKGQIDQAVSWHYKSLELQPENWRLYHQLGDIFLGLEQWKEAIKNYRKCLELNPDYTWSYHNLGLTLTKMERWEEALSNYARIDELDPEFWRQNPVDFEIQHKLGDILFQQQEFEKAINAYQRAILLNPNSYSAYHKIGDALLILQKWQEAEISFRHAIEINPNFNWSHYNLGEVLSKQGKLNDAITAYKKALELDPNMPYVREKLSQALHQQLLESASAAINFYTQSEKIQLEQEQDYVYAKVYEKLKNILKISQSPIISTENTDSYYQTGESIVRQRQWSKAITYLRQAFELNPKIDHHWRCDTLGKRSNQIDLGIEISSRPAKNNKEITIIIPIYNAYEDTQRCIEALIKYTDPKYDILLIDDCSSDTRVTEFVKQVARQKPQITCIKNPQNLGFVKTCNFAFEITEGEDVIILNSDTMVTPGWLDKLTAVAYSHDLIASVTPLTNNGEICSVPNWLEYNDIPTGYNVEKFGKLIEEISFQRYPTIPTCVGFCTYMKREVFDKIGFFDEVSFGKGYGEENDWSRRAIEAGYYHVIDDTTFVYHAGGKSFGVEEKEQLVLNNFAPLKNKHPDYFQEIHDFISAKPVQEIVSNVQLHLKLQEIRKLSPVCFIIHNNPDIPVNFPLGGTEYHCQALIQQIRKTQPVYTLCYNQVDETLLFNIFLETEVMRFEFSCPLDVGRTRNYQSPEFLKIFIQIIQYFNPRLIHIHHIINFPLLDTTVSLKQLDIPYFITLHDYYLICPKHNLLDWQGQFCYEHKNDQYCRQCIQSSLGEGKDLKQQWYTWCKELMGNAAAIFAPSQVTRSYFAREYPGLGDKIKVVRHGVMEEAELKQNLPFRNSKASQPVSFPLKIAFVGGIDQKKGLNIIIDLLQAVDARSELRNCFEFELHGATSQPIPESVKNLKICDRYQRKNLPNLLKSVDLVMFPGIWPETYCLVADEVLALGTPIIATPLGAIAERVKKYEVGWVSRSDSVDDLLEVLTAIVQNPRQVQQIKQNVKNYPIISFESMTHQYLEKYNQFPAVKIDATDQSETRMKPQSLFFAQLKAQWFFSNK